MKNWEKYEDQIKEMYRNCDGFGIKNGKPINCETNADCILCDFFNSNKGCPYERIQWLYSEYKEPIILTPFENEVLKRLNECGYQYLARDNNILSLYAYKSKPTRRKGHWTTDNIYIKIEKFVDDFYFIEWEDEPYSIDELLESEVQS